MKSIMEDLTLVYGITSMFPHGSRAFKQLQIQDIMEIPKQKPDVNQIVSIFVKVDIVKTHIIATTMGESYEGQVLSGRKLMVEGKMHQKLEYIADLADQPIHAAHFSIPFSTFIVLGKEIDCYSEFDVTGYVEDVYVRRLDNRKIFKNVLILLNAVPTAQI